MKKQRGIDEPVKPVVKPCGCKIIGKGMRAHLVLGPDGRPEQACELGAALYGTLKARLSFGVHPDIRNAAEKAMKDHLTSRVGTLAGQDGKKNRSGE